MTSSPAVAHASRVELETSRQTFQPVTHTSQAHGQGARVALMRTRCTCRLTPTPTTPAVRHAVNNRNTTTVTRYPARLFAGPPPPRPGRWRHRSGQRTTLPLLKYVGCAWSDSMSDYPRLHVGLSSLPCRAHAIRRRAPRRAAGFVWVDFGHTWSSPASTEAS